MQLSVCIGSHLTPNEHTSFFEAVGMGNGLSHLHRPAGGSQSGTHKPRKERDLGNFSHNCWKQIKIDTPKGFR